MSEETNLSLIHGLKLGFSLFTSDEKKRFFLYGFLVSLFSIFEIFALLSLMPLIAIIVDSSYIFSNAYFSEILTKLNISSYLYDNKRLVFYISLFSIFLLIISYVLNIFSHYLILKFGAQSSTRLAQELMTLTFNVNLKWFHNKNNSILTRIFFGDITLWGNDFSQKLLTMTQKLTLVLFALIILVMSFPFYGPLCFLLIFLLAFTFIYVVKPRLKNMGIYVRNKSDQLVQICEYCFGGLVDILLTTSKRYFLNEYVNKFRNFNVVKYKSDILNMLPSMSLMLIGQISVVLLTLYMVSAEKSAQEITSTLALLVLLSSRIIPAINRVSGDVTGFIRSFGFISRLLELRQQLIEMQLEKKDTLIIDNISDWKNLKLSKINFSYDDNQTILNNLTFEFKKGEIYGIIGKSGAGKTTFINILMRLVDQDNGKVLLDNEEIKIKHRNNWFKEIGLVPQNPFLLHGSILENIAFGHTLEKIDKKHLDEVIKTSRLESLINKSNDGIYTNIGDKGRNISGGQKQRIAIARALYKKPKIIIFDEATNSLDQKTTSEIIKIIQSIKNNKLIIIITHDKEVIKYCDKTILLDHGKLINKSN